MKGSKYEKRIQTPVDNTVNDLRHEIKFENHEKNKSNFFIKENIFLFYSWKSIFLKIPKNLITSAFSFDEADTKNIDTHRQKHRVCRLPRRISNPVVYKEVDLRSRSVTTIMCSYCHGKFVCAVQIDISCQCWCGVKIVRERVLLLLLFKLIKFDGY